MGELLHRLGRTFRLDDKLIGEDVRPAVQRRQLVVLQPRHLVHVLLRQDKLIWVVRIMVRMVEMVGMI